MPNTVFIDIPPDFSFRSTVYSHGWSELTPFALDTETWRLSYVFTGANGESIPAVIFEEKGKIRVDLDVKTDDTIKILADTRHILRLDDDLSGLYESITGYDRLKWVTEYQAGRLLRSPTVWEDLIKTICTTNCSWALTKSMVSNLVEKLGTKTEPQAPLLPEEGWPKAGVVGVAGGTHATRSRFEDKKTSDAGPLPPADVPTGRDSDKRAFPTAEAMASVPEEFYRTEIRAGYRSPYFVELAVAVTSGKVDPQEWLTSDMPTPELKKAMKKVKGVGDYAAENLLKLVGRYDGLALDSFLRSQFYKTHNKEKICPDKKIEKHYKKFGQWRALVIWCDMTEKWINQ